MLITLDLPNDMASYIEALAKQSGKNNAQLLTDILLEQLPKLTDLNTSEDLRCEPTDDMRQAMWEAESGQTTTFHSVTALIDEANS